MANHRCWQGVEIKYNIKDDGKLDSSIKLFQGCRSADYANNRNASKIKKANYHTTYHANKVNLHGGDFVEISDSNDAPFTCSRYDEPFLERYRI